jgi:hypothetical protein
VFSSAAIRDPSAAGIVFLYFSITYAKSLALLHSVC